MILTELRGMGTMTLILEIFFELLSTEPALAIYIVISCRYI